MARPLRIEYPGALCRVTARGDGRENIYPDDHDRNGFLALPGQTRVRFDWVVYACCLMSNHHHLLLETGDANFSRGMRHLNGVYTQCLTENMAGQSICPRGVTRLSWCRGNGYLMRRVERVKSACRNGRCRTEHCGNFGAIIGFGMRRWRERTFPALSR